jgi:hypothetical protein
MLIFEKNLKKISADGLFDEKVKKKIGFFQEISYVNGNFF